MFACAIPAAADDRRLTETANTEQSQSAIDIIICYLLLVAPILGHIKKMAQQRYSVPCRQSKNSWYTKQYASVSVCSRHARTIVS